MVLAEKRPQTQGTLMKLLGYLRRKEVLSWTLYDWANSAFSTTVMAGLFPVFFKEYWSQGVDASLSTYYLGNANSLSGLALAIASPFLGVFAERASGKKSGLMIFSLLGILSTLALAFIPGGSYSLAALVFGLGVFGFTASFVFYDSLLVDIAAPSEYDEISGLGYALGYLGGGVLFVFNIATVLSPTTFGLADKVEAVKFSFITVAVWWFLFSLPIYRLELGVGAKKVARTGGAIKKFFKAMSDTASEIFKHKEIFYFLMGYFFYIEGVNTLIKMAVDFGMAIGLESTDLIKALILVQFVAFPFAILFGWIGQKIGASRGLFLCLFIYLLIAGLAIQLTSALQFYFLAAAIGSVQGGIQSLSRSLFASLVPAEKSGEYFGFFNMLGRFSAVLGPFLMGYVSLTTGNPRSSIWVLVGLFLMGLVFLTMHLRAKKKA